MTPISCSKDRFDGLLVKRGQVCMCSSYTADFEGSPYSDALCDV